MYSDKIGLILTFHGCEENLRDDIVSGRDNLKSSNNIYDWLGDGIYFWENSPERALDFANQLKNSGKLKTPSVSDAVIVLNIVFT